MNRKYRIEACVESFEEALIAQQRGADQIELCSRLDLDGLTPDKDLIKKCVEELTLDIKVMIRPRGGDFTYNAEEISLMKACIDYCKSLKVHGVVFGMLTEGALNIDIISELAKYASPLMVTVHKAIDYTDDIIAQTKKLVSIHEHIDTILTSGGAKTAQEGGSQLLEMITICRGKINIMPAGKVTEHNLNELHELLQAPAYHGRKIVGDLQQGASE